jgi:hypothetical protein
MRKQLVPIVTALFEVNDFIEIYKNLAEKFDDALVEHVKDMLAARRAISMRTLILPPMRPGTSLSSFF